MYSPGSPGQPPGGAPGRPPGAGYAAGPPATPPVGRPPAGQPPAPPADRGPRRRRRWPWITAVAVGVVSVLIAVTAATGGLASDGTGPEQVPLGKSIDQVHFESTVLGGSWTTEKLGRRTYRNMTARIRVTNTSDRPATLFDYAKAVIPLQAWGGAMLSAQAKAYTGGTKTDELTPGVPTDVVINYTPNEGEEHAKRLTLRFCGFQHRSDFYYRGHQVWVPDCNTWSSFDPREMVSPQDIKAPGLSQAQLAQKARELNKQGAEARKRKVFDPEGIVAQVSIPLKGGS